METQLEKEKKFKNQNVNHINKKMDDKLNCIYLTAKQIRFTLFHAAESHIRHLPLWARDVIKIWYEIHQNMCKDEIRESLGNLLYFLLPT